jgi:hypothetical protein
LLALFLSEGDSISICHAHFSRENQAKAIRTFTCYRILVIIRGEVALKGGASLKFAQEASSHRKFLLVQLIYRFSELTGKAFLTMRGC